MIECSETKPESDRVFVKRSRDGRGDQSVLKLHFDGPIVGTLNGERNGPKDTRAKDAEDLHIELTNKNSCDEAWIRSTFLSGFPSDDHGTPSVGIWRPAILVSQHNPKPKSHQLDPSSAVHNYTDQSTSNEMRLLHDTSKKPGKSPSSPNLFHALIGASTNSTIVPIGFRLRSDTDPLGEFTCRRRRPPISVESVLKL